MTAVKAKIQLHPRAWAMSGSFSGPALHTHKWPSTPHYSFPRLFGVGITQPHRPRGQARLRWVPAQGHRCPESPARDTAMTLS